MNGLSANCTQHLFVNTNILKITTMKNFDEKEKQVQEICDKVRNADFIDTELKIAYYDINKIVREAYYEGCSDGSAKMAGIHEKNQELINNLFKF